MLREVLSSQYTIGSTARIGDGNPAALYAAESQHRRNPATANISYYEKIPDGASKVGRVLHRTMTAFELLRAWYTKSGENAVRGGVVGTVFGSLLFHSVMEMIKTIPEFQAGIPADWIVVQEHMLYGASPNQLANGTFNSISLKIPDSFPKQSALTTAQKHPQIELVTWNEVTFQALSGKGYRATLESPQLLSGLTGSEHMENIANKGVPVIVKTSGSGMPPELQNSLLKALEEVVPCWEFHHPGGAISSTNSHVTKKPYSNQRKRIERYFSALGGKTELLCTYPNEQVQVLDELVRNGCTNIKLLIFPPRGDHEVKNLVYLYTHFREHIHGIVIRKDPDHYPWVSLVHGIPIYKLNELTKAFADFHTSQKKSQ